MPPSLAGILRGAECACFKSATGRRSRRLCVLRVGPSRPLVDTYSSGLHDFTTIDPMVGPYSFGAVAAASEESGGKGSGGEGRVSGEGPRRQRPRGKGCGFWVVPVASTLEQPMSRPLCACVGRDTAVGLLARGALGPLVRCRSSSVFEPVLSCLSVFRLPLVFSNR